MYNPQLETFLCVADSGSFNKAAEQLYISPPAVIKQINLLENSLGIRLFTRTHRGLTLTKAGQSMYQDAKYIIQYCKDSVTRAKNAMRDSDSVIRIGTSPMTPAQVLVDLWPKLQEYCPNAKFQLVPFDNTPENAREILGNLGRNIDVVAGIFDQTMLGLRRCAGLEISKEPICCAVSIHHRLAQKDRLTVEDLYGEKLMLMRREWSHYVDELRDDMWNRVIGTNLSAVYFCAREVGKVMLKNGYGKIINIGSVHSEVVMSPNTWPVTAYASAKGGVKMLTKGLAAEWAGRGITVNAIGPAYFNSEMTASILETEGAFDGVAAAYCPMKRPGLEGELDGALIYFASDASSYTTGQLLVVDGGWTTI